MNTHTDPFGLPLSVADAASAAAVRDFVTGFLSYQPHILAVLGAAERDDSLIVQACAATLQLFSEGPGGPAAAQAHLLRAARAALPADDRERAYADAVSRWAAGDVGGAIQRLSALVERWPTDLASLKLGQYLAFNLGDSPTMLRLALRGQGEQHAWLHGLRAFAFEQCHRLPEAERAAWQALEIDPHEAWAQHAIAHVRLTQGRLREGADFLQARTGTWHHHTSFMRTHNWWHLAVFRLELGDAAEALRLYDTEVWGVDKTYSQDQVGAVSLLARLELSGVDVGDRWVELAPWLAARVADQVQPFLDLQYLYGLARAGRPEATTLLGHLLAFAPHAPLAARESWQSVAVPAAQGLLAYAQGRWRDAALALEQALPRLVSIGGSHAQRDLFEQIHLGALERGGELAGAFNRLQPLANVQHESVRVARALAQVTQALGLPRAG